MAMVIGLAPKPCPKGIHKGKGKSKGNHRGRSVSAASNKAALQPKPPSRPTPTQQDDDKSIEVIIHGRGTKNIKKADLDLDSEISYALYPHDR